MQIGCDLNKTLCRSALPLFKNKEILAVNQDELGIQARRVASTSKLPARCDNVETHTADLNPFGDTPETEARTARKTHTLTLHS